MRLAGELDLLQAAEVEATLSELMHVGFDRFVVDLRGLSFMDSTGLRALLDADRALRGRRGHLSLVCDGGPVRRLLELTGTDGVFTLDDARTLS